MILRLWQTKNRAFICLVLKNRRNINNCSRLCDLIANICRFEDNLGTKEDER
jgi:hypothetical protein